MERITREKLELLKTWSKEKRKLANRLHFGYFLTYYLPHYIKHEFAHFHYDMMQDVHDLLAGTIKELAWVEFRESAKTAFAKGLILYLLCYDLDEYINADAFDKDNSERTLFDVVWELQTNARIINDFGEIYNTQRSAEQVTQKRISNFVTNPVTGADGGIIRPGIRVEAHSTQEPVRGRTHGAKRPGWVILDDFETRKTIRSEAHTQEIREHIQEFKGGVDTARGRILYLANYLSEFANVQSLVERAKVDHKLRVRVVPIVDDMGNPTWPQKYVKTDAEITGNMVSVEEIRRKMWTPENGDDDFMAEMMCRPINYANKEFKKEWLEQNRYLETELQGKRLYNFICFDNAPSQNPNSDFIGCTVISVDAGDTWYVRYVKRYKLNSPELIDEMYRLNSVYNPKVVGFEQKGYEGLIKPFVLKRGQELRQVMHIVELKDGGRNKENRIRGRLQGRFSSGRVKLKKYATDDTPELIKELAQFPHSKLDDLSDSLQYHGDIAYAPQSERPVEDTSMAGVIKKDIQSAYERFQEERKGSMDTI